MSTNEVLESYLLLRRTVALIRAAETKNLSFGHNQISFLYRLSLSSATMGELSEYSSSDKASTSRTISALEKEGLVKRVSDPKDRRVIRIELTAKGRVQAKQAHLIRSHIGQKLDQFLSAPERKQFHNLIQKIVEGFQNETPSK